MELEPAQVEEYIPVSFLWDLVQLQLRGAGARAGTLGLVSRQTFYQTLEDNGILIDLDVRHSAVNHG